MIPVMVMFLIMMLPTELVVLMSLMTMTIMMIVSSCFIIFHHLSIGQGYSIPAAGFLAAGAGLAQPK